MNKGNPFMAAMGGNNLQQMMGQLRANPAQFLAQRGLNVPAELMNDPNAILQHLLSTGKVSQQQINNAYQMMGQFRH